MTCTHPDLEQLLGLARGGDALALGQLLELYRSYLTLLARLQLGRRLQGKFDAAAVAFLEAHRNFAQFRGSTETELASWLRQILASKLARLVRHYCGTLRRNIRLERDLEADMNQSSRILNRALVAPQSSPSQRAARREEAVLLADALDQLPEHYREVMIWHHLEGLSLPEVARRMKRTVPSVEKLWARALIQLRGLLGGSP